MRHDHAGERPHKGEPRPAAKLPAAGAGGIAPLRIRIEVRAGGRPSGPRAPERLAASDGGSAPVHFIELRGDGAVLVAEGELPWPEREAGTPLVRRIVSFN